MTDKFYQATWVIKGRVPEELDGVLEDKTVVGLNHRGQKEDRFKGQDITVLIQRLTLFQNLLGYDSVIRLTAKSEETAKPVMTAINDYLRSQNLYRGHSESM